MMLDTRKERGSNLVIGPIRDDFEAPQTEGTESLQVFLVRRKRELLAQIAALKGQLGTMERELQEIELATSALSNTRADTPRPIPLTSAGVHLSVGHVHKIGTEHLQSRFQAMTIKELVVQALLDAFPSGASSAQIRNFIRDAYGRNIEAASLRPQMHRLKGDGKLVTRTTSAGEIWDLDERARHLYARYDHPTSRKAMRELQDELPVNDSD